MQTKTCSKCKETKNISLFYRDKNKPYGDSYRSECGECSRKIKRKRYHTKPGEKKRNLEKTYKTRKLNRLYVYTILINSKCIDCGDARWQVLDFDHVRGKKLNNICNMVHDSSIKKIQLEIEKCEVRCSNCHRMKTSEQLNYYPYLKE
jgi:hypothetical protein